MPRAQRIGQQLHYTADRSLGSKAVFGHSIAPITIERVAKNTG